MKKIIQTASIALTLSSFVHASDLTSAQKTEVLKKCQEQAATLAHQVDENSKPHVNYEKFEKSKITHVDSGYEVHTSFTIRWDVEAYDASRFIVEMSAAYAGACELKSIRRL